MMASLEARACAIRSSHVAASGGGVANESGLQIFAEYDEHYRRYRQRRDGGQGRGASHI